MTCAEFVAGFSDYYDGNADESFAVDARRHLETCGSCRRYRTVVASAAELLRELPTPELREDFHPRLQHTLFSEEEALVRRHSSSGSTALAVAGISVFLAAVAWSPVLRPAAPVVELAPIVVSSPPPPVRRTLYRPGDTFRPRPAAQRGLWEDPQALLYEYSPLSRRYGRRSPPQRTGLEEDR